MTDLIQDKCECGAVVAPGERFCQLCGIKRQLTASLNRIHKLEQENNMLRQRLAQTGVMA